MTEEDAEESPKQKKRELENETLRCLHVYRRELKKKLIQKALPYPFIGRNMLFALEVSKNERIKLTLMSDGRFSLTLKRIEHQNGMSAETEGYEGYMSAEPLENQDVTGHETGHAMFTLTAFLKYTSVGKSFVSTELCQDLSFQGVIGPFFKPKYVNIQCLNGLLTTHTLYTQIIPCILCDPLLEEKADAGRLIGKMNRINRHIQSVPSLPNVQSSLPPPGSVVQGGRLVRPMDRISPMDMVGSPKRLRKKFNTTSSSGLNIKVDDCRIEAQGGQLGQFLASNTLAPMQSVENMTSTFSSKFNTGITKVGSTMSKCQSTPMLRANMGMKHSNTQLDLRRQPQQSLGDTNKDRYWKPKMKITNKRSLSPLRSHRSSNSGGSPVAQKQSIHKQQAKSAIDKIVQRETLKSPMMAKKENMVKQFNDHVRPPLSPKSQDRDAWRDYYNQRAANFLHAVRAGQYG